MESQSCPALLRQETPWLSPWPARLCGSLDTFHDRRSYMQIIPFYLLPSHTSCNTTEAMQTQTPNRLLTRRDAGREELWILAAEETGTLETFATLKKQKVSLQASGKTEASVDSRSTSGPFILFYVY